MKNRRNIVVYVSGKYSGDIPENIRIARIAGAELWDNGYTSLVPHLNCYHFEEICKHTSYDDFISGDLVLLSRSDVIFMLEGWQESKGAKIEHAVALERGIPVVYSLQELNNISEQLISEIGYDD